MIEINGKTYRNIQEQVAKNKDDIETLQGNVINLASEDLTLDQKIINTNIRIDNLLKAEDTDYKTELVFAPDDLYLKYYDKDPENPETYSFALVQKMFELDGLRQIHLYAHNIKLYAKFKNAGVVDDNFTGQVLLTLYTTSRDQLTEATLKQIIRMATTASATGYIVHTVDQNNYGVIGITKYSDQVSTDLQVEVVKLNGYAASGYVSFMIGEIITLTDKVVAIY